MMRGRPTSYRPEFVQQLIEYFDRPAWDKTDSNGNVTEGNFPTLSGFAAEIGVTQQTVRLWAYAKDIDDSWMYPDFLSAYERAKNKQEQLFVQGYMRGAYTSPTIGALIAKNLMSWKDKQELEQTVTATVDANVTVTSSLSETLDKIKSKRAAK